MGRLEDATSGVADPPSLAVTLDLLRATDRLASWAAAQRARLVAQVHTFSDREHHTWSGRSSSLAVTETVVETAALLKLSEGSAARLVSESLTLTGELTNTLTALERGEICPARASVIVEQSRTLPDDAVHAFEAEILKTAGDVNRPRLTARCRRLREKLHPETLTARRVKAAADRCVVFEPDQDGMAWFSAFLPAEQALALHTTVDAAARTLRADDDPRTLPQLRADVLADMLLSTGGTTGVAAASCENRRGGGDSTDAGHAGRGARSSSAKIVVTVPVFSLMGLTDEPAELEGYGPIPADAARKLAADATSWMRLLTHPCTGAVLGLDRMRYRPSEDLRTWVQLRDKTCCFYGCSRPASRCDLDHLLAWADDGSTGPDNLHPACKRHHMLKHQTDWTPSPDPSGGLTWLSPGGRAYTTPPEPPPGEAGSSPTARILQGVEIATRVEQMPEAAALPPF
ncbi:HNH endonuclease signature motif containing protein [Arthrobacter sp. B0490]|uniref:HNH endonuclease n=1 Tax=Arthrobacter sp. B0490 TaxID=2058891 RepID=UPI0015E3D8C9|nr:HNH endonuclease signature motif containing protein [Arthrobacter sp. B0490]